MNRVGDREVVRVRPFVRVTANLSLSVTEIRPTFRLSIAQKLLADGRRRRRADEDAAARSRMPKSRSSRASCRRCCRARRSRSLPADEVIARVRDSRELDRQRPAARITFAVASRPA